MTYTVLARRYRSQSFDQVVGQEPIARTLKNAIAGGRVAHAYLFSGTRGVGKTSMARIFARALNAPQSMEDAPLPTHVDAAELPDRDVQQRMADAIMAGQDLNVIEIDGASNNSVDQARQLIANAGLSPTANALYKIYIIDEVHMLSGAAFNALLKTMEEPPGHVKFILCTTEPHKVPPTIQSRCQRFDFRNISTAKIAAHLGDLVKQEGVQADEPVIWQLARLGNGSMRDALSLLDRLIATGESPLTIHTFEEMFGLPDEQLVNDLIDAIAQGRVDLTLERGADLLAGGISQDQLVDVLIEHFRVLMLVAACGADSEWIELSEQAREHATEQAAKFDATALTYLIALCENLQRSSRTSSNPRALFDATLVRLALAEKMADINALLSAEPVSGSRVTQAAGRGREAIGKAPGAGESEGRKKKRNDEPAEAVETSGAGRADAGESEIQVRSSLEPAKPPAPRATPPATSPYDLEQVWDALRQSLADRPGLAWSKHLMLCSLDDHTGVVAPTPGHREVAGFANSQRLAQIAAELEPVLGRRVKLRLRADSPDGVETDQAPTDARRQAMDLPLVRSALEAFPDATLVSVRVI